MGRLQRMVDGTVHFGCVCALLVLYVVVAIGASIFLSGPRMGDRGDDVLGVMVLWVGALHVGMHTRQLWLFCVAGGFLAWLYVGEMAIDHRMEGMLEGMSLWQWGLEVAGVVAWCTVPTVVCGWLGWKMGEERRRGALR